RDVMVAASTWSEVREFISTLRAERYDDVIDTQGLIRSAMIARLARGRSHGYDASSIKERPASLLYDVRYSVGRAQHAIERNRALTALALGYSLEGSPDYGLERTKLAPPSLAPYGVLLHATARREKEWPAEHWRALAEILSRDFDIIVPFGTDGER